MSGEKSSYGRKRFAPVRPDFDGQAAVCAVLSGLLLTAAFRPFAMAWVAWVALIPVGFTVCRASRWGSVQLAVLCGVVHWLSAVWWVGKVTSAGMIALALYCALYFVPPLLIWRGWDRRRGWKGWRGVAGLLLVAGAWSGTEQIRATVLTGFPWNMLGVTQVEWTALIGIADLGGVVAVSFLVMAANVACLVLVTGPPHERGLVGLVSLALVGGACIYGRVADREPVEYAHLKIGLVQPNVPLDEKWDMAFQERIFRTLERQTLPLANAEADLIVWPETVLPFYLMYDAKQLAFVYTLLANGSPILAGSMHSENVNAEPMHMMNSSFFFRGAGAQRHTKPARYDKQHLVLVGEYVPWPELLLPILQSFSPMQENVTPGDETVLFALDGDPSEPLQPFSVLICFEDTVPYLARRAARKGATWLVNQTNDGWFDGTPGSRQHLANARFRCVENRMPMVRSTNTGATAGIDAAGRITALLDDGAGNVVLQEGRLLVDLVPSDGELTVYTRWGDVFGWGCAILSGCGGFWLWLTRRRV